MSRSFRTMIITFCTAFMMSGDVCSAAKLCNTFLCRIGGEDFKAGDERLIAKYDLILCNRFHYDDVGGNTWKTLKALNPGIQIHLYVAITFVQSSHDSFSVLWLNDFGRYGNARGHSMGDLSRANPGLFLKDNEGKRIHADDNDDAWFLDFGNPLFHQYAIEAMEKDLLAKPWTADGVYSDGCMAVPSSVSPLPAKYTAVSSWRDAMNAMISAVTDALEKDGQAFSCNRGLTRGQEGVDAWLALDQVAHPPAAVLEEGAFVVGWGAGDAQYYGEEEWKRQVDLLGRIRRSKVLYLSHCFLNSPQDDGVDHRGRPFSFQDAFYYALGSFLLGRNDTDKNSYFQMSFSKSYSRVDYYYDEYDKIDLGPALGPYGITKFNGVNIYSREFTNGYVYVNPTLENVTSINLPESCRQILPENVNIARSSIPGTITLSLKPHRAAILYKASRLPPPLNIRQAY